MGRKEAKTHVQLVWYQQHCNGFIPLGMFPLNCHSILEYPKIQWFGGFKWKKYTHTEKIVQTTLLDLLL